MSGDSGRSEMVFVGLPGFLTVFRES